MVTVRDAATVMLVRDAPDLEVFMLLRNMRSMFVRGASLFPGGAVDAHDRSAEVARRAPGSDDTAASERLGRRSGGLGFWVAAARETFEEAGVALMRDRGSGLPPDAASPEVSARLAAARRRLNDGEATFARVLADADLELDPARLHVFAHWITPHGAPRRYDTWFFVAEAPAGHAYRHDEVETVDSGWVRPADALRRYRSGEIQLVYPTLRTLELFGRFTTSADLLAAVRGAAPARGAVPLCSDSGGERIPLPGDALDPPEAAVVG